MMVFCGLEQGIMKQKIEQAQVDPLPANAGAYQKLVDECLAVDPTKRRKMPQVIMRLEDILEDIQSSRAEANECELAEPKEEPKELAARTATDADRKGKED